MYDKPLSIGEDVMAVFYDELYRIVLRVHVGHFSFQAVVPHNGRREDDSKIFGCHL